MYSFGDSPLSQLLADSDPALVKAMADAGLFDDQTAANAAALKMAQNNMQTPMPQGQTVGRAYVAASPLEHMAAAMRMARGEYGINQAMEAQKQNMGVKRQGIDALLQIAGGRRRPPPDVVGYAAPIGTGEAGTDGWGY